MVYIDINSLRTTHETPIQLCLNNINSHDETYMWFQEVHNDQVGHLGEAETIRRLQKTGHRWKNMHKSVKRFIKFCPLCQKNNRSKFNNTAFSFTVNSYQPGEKIQINFIVKLDPDERGVDHIMVIIDSFSRWIQLYPLVGLCAINAAECIIKFASMFGVPKIISHDLDPIFLSQIFTELIHLLGSSSHRSLSHSKEENAIVERANKEVMRHLRNFIFNRAAKSTYSRYIPFVERIMNSSKHRSTGFTPAQILFGNSVDLNKNNILEEKYVSTEDISYTDWILQLKKIQDVVLTIAKDTLKEKDEIHLLSYPCNYTTFEPNSYVLVEYKNTFRPGPKSKLLPFLKGPLEVIRSEGNKIYLRDLITQKIKPYHIKRLIKFNFDPTKWNPLHIALRDTGDLFHVEKITDMKGSPSGPKSQLFFKVHWVGYEDPTYEPWANLRNNLALHTFLRSHKDPKVRKLVPNNLQTPQEEDSSEDDFP
jgi:hypothetical protein